MNQKRTGNAIKYFTVIMLSLFVYSGFAGSAAIDQAVNNVEVLDVDKNPSQIPYFGEKVLYIVYADPDVSKKGVEIPVTDSIRRAADDKLFDPELLLGMGIVNMNDSWLPNGLIRKGIEAKIKENEEKGIPFEYSPIFMDNGRLLKNEWQLGDCNNVVVMLVVGKDKRLKYVHKTKTKEDSESKINDILDIIISETKK